MLELIGTGICIAIGFYLAPFVVGIVGVIGATIIGSIAWLFGARK